MGGLERRLTPPLQDAERFALSGAVNSRLPFSSSSNITSQWKPDRARQGISGIGTMTRAGF